MRRFSSQTLPLTFKNVTFKNMFFFSLYCQFLPVRSHSVYSVFTQLLILSTHHDKALKANWKHHWPKGGWRAIVLHGSPCVLTNAFIFQAVQFFQRTVLSLASPAVF